MLKIVDVKCPKCGKIEEVYIRHGDHVRCSTCRDVWVQLIPSAPGMVKTNFADKTGFKNR